MMELVKHLEEVGFKNGYDVCLTVHTSNFDYPLSFIEFESDDVLGIMSTDEMGREKLKILNKRFVEAVEVLYADDLEFSDGEKPDNRMFN